MRVAEEFITLTTTTMMMIGRRRKGLQGEAVTYVYVETPRIRDSEKLIFR